jgi:hypothetical protein
LLNLCLNCSELNVESSNNATGKSVYFWKEVDRDVGLIKIREKVGEKLRYETHMKGIGNEYRRNESGRSRYVWYWTKI